MDKDINYAEQGDELVFGTGDFTVENLGIIMMVDINGGGTPTVDVIILTNRIGGSVGQEIL